MFESYREVKRATFRFSIILVAAFVFGLLSQGCTSFGNSSITPRDAGYAAVEIDLITKPFQTDEMKKAADVLVAIAEDGSTLGTLTDAFMREQIDEYYRDEPQETRDMVFNIYQVALNRLTKQIEKYPDMPKPYIVDEFLAGIREARADYHLTDEETGQ